MVLLLLTEYKCFFGFPRGDISCGLGFTHFLLWRNTNTIYLAKKNQYIVFVERISILSSLGIVVRLGKIFSICKG